MGCFDISQLLTVKTFYSLNKAPSALNETPNVVAEDVSQLNTQQPSAEAEVKHLNEQPLIEIHPAENTGATVNGAALTAPAGETLLTFDEGTEAEVPSSFVPIKSQNGSVYSGEEVIPVNGADNYDKADAKEDQFEKLNDVPTGKFMHCKSRPYIVDCT